MRFPTFPSIIRTIYTFNATASRFVWTLPRPAVTAAAAPKPLLAYRVSMPTIPFLGSLFSSSASSKDNMSFPVQKSSDEWQAVLNKGAWSALRRVREAPLT
jgi:peptide-methionine (R)-S-oxide reductase